jgi:hypothetical protein
LVTSVVAVKGFILWSELRLFGLPRLP